MTAAAGFLAWHYDGLESSIVIPIVIGVVGTHYVLEAYFETLKKFDGPFLFDVPGLILEVGTEGMVNVLVRLSEQYRGEVFSLGPIAIFTGNPDNIRTMYQNTKMPITALPGLPRNSGLANDSPKVHAQCLKAFIGGQNKALTKEGSGMILSNIAKDVERIMNEAIHDHNGDVFEFREAIAVPIMKASNRELVFGSSQEHKAEVEEIQNLSAEVSSLFGADGIIKTLFQPWSAVSAVSKCINTLDAAILSAPTQSGCPFGALRESVLAGEMDQFDAIATAGVFTFAGIDVTVAAANSVVRILAHPHNAQLQVECRREVDSVLNGYRKVLTSADQIRDCHLLKSTIAECFRCYEFVGAGLATPPRVAVRDFEIDGKTLTKGSLIMSTAMDNEEVSVATGNKEWVSSPSTFNPKAWLDAERTFDERLFNKFTFFGAGVHKCPGRQVGFDTTVSMIATTLSYFDDVSLMDDKYVIIPSPDRTLKLVAKVRSQEP
eukprot:CAMPEP_0194081174 /NCGR_PEP_ID=MMETSP0149-20130528/7037_1 /TAXON_ID=122233 /ORGANISM="Chaetoceros debilis, Strain MM31A-1" /LENGTH=490 /DNA_ID=CAMNT_0038763051 /DNA_START=310 /DNA_END=1782 /DNA_ORIENTATION=-